MPLGGFCCSERSANPLGEWTGTASRTTVASHGASPNHSAAVHSVRIMKRDMFCNRIIAAGAVAAFLTIAPAAGWAQGNCLSGGEARELIEQGQIVPFPDAMRQAGLSPDQVVDVQLCATGGGFVYRVRVLEGGAVRRVNIPAG